MDKYYTILKTGSSKFTEKMSRFLGFAIKVTSVDDAKKIIKDYQNKFHDARHVCWAYMIGPDRLLWQSNDNGEPSGTAGKPILGQINSFELTDVLVIVVRYFGGIKLGTSGLISAYRETARLALNDAGKIECRCMYKIKVQFSYESADKIMRIIKENDINVIERTFDNLCSVKIEFPLDNKDMITAKINNIEGAVIIEEY